MVYKDSGSVATWPTLRWNPTPAVVASVAVALISPQNGERTPSTAVPLTVAVSNNGGVNTDVEFIVSTDPAFGSTAATATVTNQPNGTFYWQPSGLSASVLYYWRARGAPTGTTTWGPWSEVRSFTIDINTSRALEYSYENVGPLRVSYSGVIDYSYENVGFQVIYYSGVIEYVHENVGFRISIDPDAVEYAFEGDVSTNTPTPRLWFLLPNSARPLDGVAIYGLGMGDLVSTFDAQVQILPTGATEWIDVPVVSWQTFPPTDDAYTEDRVLNPSTGEIDMQRTVVEILVPDESQPPGFLIRIRTDGP